MRRYESFIVVTIAFLFVVHTINSQQFDENSLSGFDDLFDGRERRAGERAFLQQLMQRLKPRFRRGYDADGEQMANFRRLMQSLKPRFKKSL